MIFICSVLVSRCQQSGQEFDLSFGEIQRELGLARKDMAYRPLRELARRGILKLVSKGRGRYGVCRYRILDYAAVCRLASSSSGVPLVGKPSSTRMTMKPRWGLSREDLQSPEGVREAYGRWCEASGETWSEARLLQIASAAQKARAVARDAVRFVAAFVRNGITWINQRWEELGRAFLRGAERIASAARPAIDALVSRFRAPSVEKWTMPDTRSARAAEEVAALERRAGLLLRIHKSRVDTIGP